MAYNDEIGIDDFARIIGVSRSTVENYIRQGRIPVLATKTYLSGTKRYKLSKELAESIKDNGGRLPEVRHHVEVTSPNSAQMF